MTKQQLREEYKKRRLSLSESERKVFSEAICKQVLSLIQDKKIVSVFLPIKRQNEVDTWQLLTQNKITFCVTKSDFETNTLTHFIYENPAQIKENEWGIPEPKYGEIIDVKAIEVVIVPLLIGDKKGHRVGYGKGFYDHFLAECSTNMLKIGVNFFEPIETIEDILATDFPIDYYISPTKTYTFEK